MTYQPADGRVLAIGDIHGCYRSLAILEKLVPFRPKDVIVTIGDYVDRGPDSKAVLEWLIAHQDQVVPLVGNHELMMLAANDSDRHYDEWISCGGDKTLRSYGRNADLSDIPGSHWQFIKSCRPYYKIKTHFFVHANACSDIDLPDQPDYMLYWEQFHDPPPHESGRVMICGHTPQRNGMPQSLGHAICIDTWAHGDGWLACLDVQSGRYWQANESSQTRVGLIED